MSTRTSRTVEINVSPDGATSIKTQGFTGGPCKDATRNRERALGVAGRVNRLPEFYAQTMAGEHVQQGS